MSPEDRDRAVDLLVKSRTPWEVEQALLALRHGDLAAVVGAALARTLAEGKRQGREEERTRLARLLGLVP